MGVEKHQRQRLVCGYGYLFTHFCLEGLALEQSYRKQMLPEVSRFPHCSTGMLEVGMCKYSTHSASLEKQLLDLFK